MILQLCMEKNSDSNHVHFFNEIKSEMNGNELYGINLIKTKPEVLTPDNITSIVVLSSMLSSPLTCLHAVLHEVYAPTLLGELNTSGLNII